MTQLFIVRTSRVTATGPGHVILCNVIVSDWKHDCGTNVVLTVTTDFIILEQHFNNSIRGFIIDNINLYTLSVIITLRVFLVKKAVGCRESQKESVPKCSY